MSASDVTPALLLIADGLGDRYCPELGGKTPLEAANTPTLDRLAAAGETGLLDPVDVGVRGGSDTGHLSILGYDPYQYYTGRGPFEALGIGMDVRPADVAFRCNFATVDENLVVTDRRAARISEGTAELAAAVNGWEFGGVVCLVKESIAHRAALVLRGEGLSDQVGDVDPHDEGVTILDAALPGADEAGARTARVVNAFVRYSYETLKDHPVNRQRAQAGQPPANVLLPRGVGTSPDLAPFDTAHGVKSACIVEVGLVKGIGRYLGMDVIDVPGSTGGLDTDTQAIGQAVVDALKDHNFVLCNVKGPDIAAHDSNPAGKQEIIEKIDHMVAQILAGHGEDLILTVTGDHTTACETGDHTGEPCPIFFWGPGVRRDAVQSFGETACGAGSVGRIRGLHVMKILTSYMNVQEKYGA